MVIKYNKEADSIYIIITEAKVAESDHEKKDIIMDYDEEGNVVGIEILNASKNTKLPNGICFEVA
jgi:uncharacterized protein YuzE